MTNLIMIYSSKKYMIFSLMFGFFIMGFIDIVGLSANYVKKDFSLSDGLSNLLPMMVFIWYALISLPTVKLMNKFGQKNIIMCSIMLLCISMIIPFIFYEFRLLLLSFALMGISNTILQVSLNPALANIIDSNRLTGMITLGQFIKSISSFLGPLAISIFVANGFSWRYLLIVYGMISFVYLILFWRFVPDNLGVSDKKNENKSLLLIVDKYILLLFVGIVFIVGIDVGLNVYIPKVLLEKGNDFTFAGLGVSAYFLSKILGTFAGSFVLSKIKESMFLKYTAISYLLSFLIMIFTENIFCLYLAIIVIGANSANVFSILLSSGIKYKQVYSNEISSLMIVGVSGGALFPPIMGIISDQYGIYMSLSVLILCTFYLFVLSYKLKH